ncbi:Transposon Ty3-I Gag-Pol polyprotein [Vitis vinifera]|uniref:Transposon Ty3-I Gag-Pol polyprotein n=1 Tax=Vitis vinifera TaxID=29760 RepID=A0A438DV49_VITVI|nr:Transposon Ty3-I Gag-Pol polyprotein [Vitis vinifera]
MKGIHPSIVSHRLNILPTAKPIRQRVRRFHPDRQKIIREEIDKLLEPGFIREVEYPDWLANVVVVPKKEGKWRVCVDYTNLDNACPKDNFPLLRIDQIVDSTAGQGMLSFLDAFSRYHQIPMASADEEKIAFITLHGLYCYKVMPFRLKNVGATYQKLMTKIFKPLVGRTVEVYIDDIVVKSKTREKHTLHLQEVFYLLRKYGMKLTSSKCAFGVSADKFLGFMVSQKGIEVSPNQVKAVMETPPLGAKRRAETYLLRQQSVGGCRNKVFKDRANGFSPSKCCSEALSLLPSPPGGRADRPALSQHPAQTGLDWTNASMAIELSENGIEFQPRLSMKGQVMVDVVLEYSRRPTRHKEPHGEGWWTLRVDGASWSSGSGVGLLLQSPTGEQLKQTIRLGFPASNNEAEYEAILSRMDLALALSVSKLRVYSDSQLVVRQVQKEYEAKDERMTQYLTKVRDTLQWFTEWTIEKIKRTENGRANALTGIAASLPIKEAILLPIHVQTHPSVA